MYETLISARVCIFRSRVYSKHNNDVEELKANIVLVVKDLRNMHNSLLCTNLVYNNLVQRVQLCIQQHSQHVERLVR